MQWWMRPGTSRCWAIRKPSPSLAEQRVGAEADVLVEDLGVAAEHAEVLAAGAPCSARRARSFTPGVSTGTMNIEARRCGVASGSVTAMTIRKSAIEPFEVNHLCPSST